MASFGERPRRNRGAFVRIVLLILIIGIPLTAHVPQRVLTPAGLALERWADASFPITWHLNPSRGASVAGTRDLADLFRESFQTWSAVTTARASFSEGATTTVTNAARDGINLISLVPTTYNSSAPSLTLNVKLSGPK